MIEAHSVLCDVVQRHATTAVLVPLLDHVGVGEGNLTTFEGLDLTTFDGEDIVTFGYDEHAHDDS